MTELWPLFSCFEY